MEEYTLSTVVSRCSRSISLDSRSGVVNKDLLSLGLEEGVLLDLTNNFYFEVYPGLRVLHDPGPCVSKDTCDFKLYDTLCGPDPGSLPTTRTILYLV